MPNWTMLCSFTVLVLVTGVFAGKSVHQCDDGTSSITSMQGDASDDCLIPNVAPSRFINASHQTFTNEDDSTEDQLITSRPGPSMPEQTLEVTKPVVADSANRKAVSDLIQKMFPQADPDTAEIWVDSYGDMDLSEVEFILQQKQQLSGSLTLTASSNHSGTSFDAVPVASRVENDSIRTVKANLRNAWSVGFRRTVVLPSAASSSPNDVNHSMSELAVTTFTSFDHGRIVSSPVPTHVSLPTTENSVMFCLEGGKFTRRGDFQLLPDRRVGLITANGPISIVDSPVIPSEALRLRLSSVGEIQFESNGSVQVAGSVPCVRISNMDGLKSNDGVIFESTDNSQTEPLVLSSVVLSVNSLEISNVNYEEELRLLEQLSQL